MSKVTHILLWLSLFLMSACAVSQDKSHPKVSDFIQLLVKANEPTLAEYAKFSGECGGESELIFALNECRLKDWDIKSKSCIDFTRQRCQMAEQEPSLVLSWLRERFSTVGKSYRLISTQSESEGIDFIDVEIGKNKFLLFHDTRSYPPGGLVIDVSKVNGKNIVGRKLKLKN